MNSATHPEKGSSDSRKHRVVAVGLLSEHDLSLLGRGFKRLYRLDDGHDFQNLLTAIDEAERKFGATPSHA